jgi:hypothetical protein
MDLAPAGRSVGSQINPASETPPVSAPRISRSCLAGLGCLAVIVFFHSPRWWLIVRETPGAFEWARALTYLKQCADPFRTDIEPAMRWRFIPQILVFALGRSPAVALLIPWLGCWALLAFVHYTARSRAIGERDSLMLTLVIGATAPVLVSTGWLGINDAWVILGLCYLIFGGRRWLLVLACVACPLIDERFIFGVPYVIALRALPAAAPGKSMAWLKSVAPQVALALLPFVLVREIGTAVRGGSPADAGFMRDAIRDSRTYLAYAPVGLLMAIRIAVVPAAPGLVAEWRKRRGASGIVFGLAGGAVLIGFLLAADTMRTAGLLVPLLLWGTLATARAGTRVPWRWLALAALLLPAAQVTNTKIAPINSLPVEVWRLIRINRSSAPQ